MKRLSYLGFLFLAASWLGCSSQPREVTKPGDSATPPPVLDRELFFGDPLVTAGQLSPDGQYIAFIKPYQGVRNVWVKRLDESFDSARPITADKRPVPAFFWSRDSRHVLYVQDKGGNENYHVYAVVPSAAPEAATGVPAARDLTAVEGVRAAIYSVPRTTPDYILVGLNDRDPSYHDVYRVSLATGERTLLIKNDQKVGFFFFDQNGTVRLAFRQIPGGSTEILRVDGNDLVPIYVTTYEESAFPLRFHPDNKRVYLQTNVGSNIDRSELVLMDVATGKTEKVESDPEGEVDFGSAVFHDETDELLATVYVGNRVRIYPKTAEIEHDLQFLRSKLPDGDLELVSSSKDMSVSLIAVSSDVDPGSVYLYKRKDGGSVELVYRSRPELPGEHLAHMQPVSYTARDGLKIPAYLTLPKGVEAKNLPALIFPHGGPWARDNWEYDPYTQFLANRGYAVLQPNFRGSSGYGKKFLNAGNHEWGTGAMQHDISDGVAWLIEQGIADPRRICIFGGSYGGYATLAGVTFTPDLYACGIPYVAPSNLITLIESFPAYWRPFLEGSWYRRVGDPASPADRKDLEARSPLAFVDRIKVPLLVVHGANDPRVKQAESDRIVMALRDKGQPVEYIVAPDEGHGFRAPENRMALAVATERFLARHLGGRVQTDVTPEVARRLSEITVDVASVKAPSAADVELLATAMKADLPATSGKSLAPVVLEYKGALQMGPQNLDMVLRRTIEAGSQPGRPTWRVHDTAEMTMGNVSDLLEVDKTTLQPIERTLTGFASGKVVYDADRVHGSLDFMGQKTDFDTPLPAPVWADGPGLSLSISGLPLVDGYATTFRWHNSSTHKVEAFKLAVTGSETITVPAGTFETYVVEYQPLGDAESSGKLWVVYTAPHHEVKGEHRLPMSTGGGLLTAELTKISAPRKAPPGKTKPRPKKPYKAK